MSAKRILSWVSLLAVIAASAAMPATTAGAVQPQIAPIQSHPYGQTYSEWAADWWQFVLETPASINPVLDSTGANCDQGDMGNVWFLFGSFEGSVERSCKISVGTALFFPLINSVSARFESEATTEKELRDSAACVKDAATTLLFEFNGGSVNSLDRFLEESATFEAQLPEVDAIFGLDGIFVDLGVDAGFYLLLRPLPPGRYKLHWEASSAACNSTQDITYNLTVTRGPRR